MDFAKDYTKEFAKEFPKDFTDDFMGFMSIYDILWFVLCFPAKMMCCITKKMKFQIFKKIWNFSYKGNFSQLTGVPPRVFHHVSKISKFFAN